MIPFDFAYYKPSSLEEAIGLFAGLAEQGKNPMYYAGGTEIISFSRLYRLFPQAVIDIKGIPECGQLTSTDGKIVFGSAVTLGRIQEANVFPLLSWCGGRVADRTIRNKISLGGNICSRLPYREAVLSLLVADSEVIFQNRQGRRTLPINQVFDRTLRLEPGEILVQVVVDRELVQLPFTSFKMTSDGPVGYPQDRIGYPVVSGVALKTGNGINLAFSGLCAYPLRSPEMEEVLNQRGLPREERINRAVGRVHPAIIDDFEGSSPYRAFVLTNMLSDMLARLEG